MKKKPIGFVAMCQCGAAVGALDYNRTDRKEAGQLLGKWLADGCTIEPRFTSSWQANISSCKCDESQTYEHGERNPEKHEWEGDLSSGVKCRKCGAGPFFLARELREQVFCLTKG